MKNYKITIVSNGAIQYTVSGKDLYCSILDKFNIEYKVEEINENDNPHSEVRRMESEGVIEKFSDENSSSDSYEHNEHYWDTERNKDIQDFEIENSKMHQPVYFNEEWNASNTLGNDEVEVRFVYEPNKPL